MKLEHQPTLPWSGWQQSAVAGTQHFGQGLALGMALLLWLVAEQGQAKALATWLWWDVLAEGGGVLMLAVWLTQVRASRPAGHVTTLLCLGLTGLLLGAWMDWLDEFWKLPKAPHWLHGLESGFGLIGMLVLTWGLHEWRREQQVLNQQWQRRERLFRDTRSLDGVTQLADASYMAAQITLERQAGRRAEVLMLGWQGFETVARRHGLAEAERMLQAAGQLLLLNLRPQDLLCRYGADRFVALLPHCDAAQGAALATELQAALAAFHHSSADGQARHHLPVRSAHAGSDSADSPEALLLQLLERLPR